MRYAALMIIGLVAAGPASAEVVTRDFSLAASNFQNFSGDASPITDLSATFRLTYDEAASGFQGAPVSFKSISNGVENVGPFAAMPIFGYFPAGGMSSFPRLGVGGALNGGNTLVNGTDDFYFTFDASAVGATSAMLSFTSVGHATPFTTFNAVVTPIQISASVPEPATWGMMILGVGIVGGAMRRREKVRATVNFV
jgi:hypothetical protein